MVRALAVSNSAVEEGIGAHGNSGLRLNFWGEEGSEQFCKEQYVYSIQLFRKTI